MTAPIPYRSVVFFPGRIYAFTDQHIIQWSGQDDPTIWPPVRP